MSETQNLSTRDQIQTAAYELFLEHGYHGTSMRQIAARTGLTVAALYNHFPGKEPLFQEVLLAQHPFHAFLNALQDAQGASAEDLLRDAARLVVESLSRERRSVKLLFVEVVEFDNRHMPSLIREYLPHAMTFVEQLYLREPALRAHAPAVIIRSFLGLFFSYYMSDLMFAQHLPQETPERAFRAFVDIYLRGVLAGKTED